MRHKVVILLFAVITFAINKSMASQQSIINCTWPCAEADQQCVLTDTGASCQNVVTDSWVISVAGKAPTYTGATVSRNLEPCIQAPIPSLPLALPNSTITANQSIITWPIWTLGKPLDDYLGNCVHSLYCSSAGNDSARPVCRQQANFGESCISSNQCHAGYCSDGICRSFSDRTATNGRDHKSSDQSKHSDKNRIATILGSVFGVIGAIGLAIIVFFMYRRYRYRSQAKKTATQQEELFYGDHNIAASSENVFKEEQFASDFEQETSLQYQHAVPTPAFVRHSPTLTPAMRQSQLQNELLNRYSEDNDSTFLRPPPMYKP